MSDAFKLPRIPARISFNGEPPIDGEILKMNLEECQQQLAKDVQACSEDLARSELMSFAANGVAEFHFNLTFEHVAMLQARSRDKSGLNGCCGLTCNPTTYRGLLDEAKDAAGHLFTRSNGRGTFLFGIELFEVRIQKETALAWYDEKAMREYLEANR